jgi:glutathione S-transferase
MSTNSLRPLTLHAHSTGPNPYKVAILLEALNIAYTVKLWDFSSTSAGVKGPEFTAINPNGRVPALEDPNTGVPRVHQLRAARVRLVEQVWA